MNDRNLRAWFVVFTIAVFLGGMGSGVILDRFVGRPGVPRLPRAGVPAFAGMRGPAPAFAPVVPRLAGALDLTAEQKTKLEAIFAAWGQRIQQFRGDVQTRYEDLQKGLRKEIEDMLTPDQRKKFEEWLTREQLPGLRPGRGMGRGMMPGRGMGGPGRGRGPDGY